MRPVARANLQEEIGGLGPARPRFMVPTAAVAGKCLEIWASHRACAKQMHRSRSYPSERLANQ